MQNAVQLSSRRPRSSFSAKAVLLSTLLTSSWIFHLVFTGNDPNRACVQYGELNPKLCCTTRCTSRCTSQRIGGESGPDITPFTYSVGDVEFLPTRPRTSMLVTRGAEWKVTDARIQYSPIVYKTITMIEAMAVGRRNIGSSAHDTCRALGD